MIELYKYINEHRIDRARNPIFDGDLVYSNPTRETLTSLGYKELVIKEEMPVKEGYYAIPIYADGNVIVQTWELKNIEEETI